MSKFWRIHASAEYPAISDRAISVLSPFASSYLCEQGFLALTSIKCKKRECLTSVENEMHVCLSKIGPRINKLHYVTKKKSCLSEFFSAKSLFVTQKNFALVGRAEKIASSSLKLRSKSRILTVFGVFGLRCTTL